MYEFEIDKPHTYPYKKVEYSILKKCKINYYLIFYKRQRAWDLSIRNFFLELIFYYI